LDGLAVVVLGSLGGPFDEAIDFLVECVVELGRDGTV